MIQISSAYLLQYVIVIVHNVIDGTKTKVKEFVHFQEFEIVGCDDLLQLLHILLIKYCNIYYMYITRIRLNIGIMTSLSFFVISVYTVSDITKVQVQKKLYSSKSTIEQI